MTLRPCLQPGCTRIVHAGYCRTHAPLHVPHRPADERQSWTWNLARRQAIEDQPWCSLCGTTGDARNPLTLGHLKAHARGGRLADGTQVECMDCNNKKGWR